MSQIKSMSKLGSETILKDYHDSLRISMKRIESLAFELKYINIIFNVDLPNLIIPFITEIYIQYIGELFNQNILSQDLTLEWEFIKNLK